MTEVTEAEISALVDRLAQLIGYNFKKEAAKKKWTISVGRYAFEEALVAAKGHLNVHEPHKALVALYNVSDRLAELLAGYKAEELANPEVRARVIEIADLSGQISATFKRLANQQRQVEADRLESSGLFQKKDFSQDEFLYVQNEIEALLHGGLKVYSYAMGTTPLPKALPYRLAKEIIMSRDLDAYLRLLPALPRDPAHMVFLPYYKIEERADLSHWVFVLVWADHAWLATTQRDFQNPYNRESTRRPDRHKEKMYEHLWLPDLQAELASRRKKQRGLAFPGQSLEVLKKPVMELHPMERYFLVQLADVLVQHALRVDLERITTAGQFVEARLLGSDTAIPDVADNFEGMTKDVRARVAELADPILATTKDLVPMSYDVVPKAEAYDPNWLATPADQVNLAYWLVTDRRRAQIQDALDAVQKKKEQDVAALRRLLNFNVPRIIEYAFLAPEILYAYHAVETFGSGQVKSGSYVAQLFISQPEKDRGGGRELVLGAGLSDCPVLPGWSWPKGDKPLCVLCGKHAITRVAVDLRVRHWRQLLLLTNLADRALLPPYYRNYRAHNHNPYYGNCILDNTHPLARLEDPASEASPNGIFIPLYTCGYCPQRLKRHYQVDDKRAVIDEQGAVLKRKVRWLSNGYVFKVGGRKYV